MFLSRPLMQVFQSFSFLFGEGVALLKGDLHGLGLTHLALRFHHYLPEFMHRHDMLPKYNI